MTRIALIRSGPASGAADFFGPPLGLLYLGAFIRQHGYEPHIIDLKLKHLADEQVIDQVRKLRPEVIGIGAFTPDAPALHSLARVLKRAFPSIPLVVGGPHPSTDPDDVVANEAIDCAVLGEGETTFLDLLNALGAQRPLSQVAGLALAGANGTATRTALRDPIRDLDALPFPAWDLINVDDYTARLPFTFVVKRRQRYMPIFTSRACPYQCTYCHTLFGKEYRARSPEHVVAEMREVTQRYGIKVIEVFDDIFNLNWKRATAVCEAVAAAKLGVALSFPNGLRADIMRDELLTAMRAAGTYYISYAVETGTPRLQQLIKKRLNLEKTRQVIKQTVDLGIFVNGFFMLGFPTETRAEVEATIDYACSTRLHSANFFMLSPFRGTEIYEWAAKEGLVPLTEGPVAEPYHAAAVNCSALSNQELLSLKRKAYTRFFLGGNRIPRIMWHHPDKLDFLSLAWKGVKRLDLPKLLRSPWQKAAPGGGAATSGAGLMTQPEVHSAEVLS